MRVAIWQRISRYIRDQDEGEGEGEREREGEEDTPVRALLRTAMDAR